MLLNYTTVKLFIFQILFLFTLHASFGQDWQPIYLNETLNYQSSTNPDEPFGVFASDLSVASDLSAVRLALNAEPIDTCDCEASCRRLTADFLQSRVVYLPDNVVSFQNPDTFYFHIQSGLGDSWLFRIDSAGNDIMATVISISQIEIFGETDSLKIINLSDSEEIHLSQHHGITKWINANDTLTLVSIPSRGLGELYLTKAEVYDFNIGDKFWYVYENKYSNIDLQLNYYTDYFRVLTRYEVMNIANSDTLVEINFLAHHAYYMAYENSSNNQIYIDYYSENDFVGVSIDLTQKEIQYELPSNRYWQKPIFYGAAETYYCIYAQNYTNDHNDLMSQSISQTQHDEFGGRKTVNYGAENFEFQFSNQNTVMDVLNFDVSIDDNSTLKFQCNDPQELPDIGDIVSPSILSPQFEYEIAGSVVGEGLGLISFFADLQGFEGRTEVNYKLLGYVKGEEVAGFTPSIDELISVGLTNTNHALDFSVYPNPAANSLQIHMPTSDFGQLKIRDLSGRELYTMPINSENVKIETSKFPAGIYFIQIETQNGIGVKKVIVSR